MMLQTLLLHINAIACAVAAFRLFSYRRRGATHRWVARYFAYFMIVAFASVPLRIISGSYVNADVSETIINIVLCIVIVRAGGNVMNMFRTAKN